MLGNEHSTVSVYQGEKNPDTDGHQALLKQKTMECKEYPGGTFLKQGPAARNCVVGEDGAAFTHSCAGPMLVESERFWLSVPLSAEMVKFTEEQCNSNGGFAHNDIIVLEFVILHEKGIVQSIVPIFNVDEDVDNAGHNGVDGPAVDMDSNCVGAPCISDNDLLPLHNGRGFEKVDAALERRKRGEHQIGLKKEGLDLSGSGDVRNTNLCWRAGWRGQLHVGLQVGSGVGWQSRERNHEPVLES
ncbi:hypothetical protein B0H14DRAFT_2609493 [Mycena olivaceomarginata]|nr:hypothetical protein B0H14DRAFT_2609493 [Mycena olivaceomarginata]